ncbi:ATP-binding protein [Fibrella forsythiae]|uniref:ATP-binding protein n=1 Tax=Fibrella forsythiae TaxID=2817061 RepID=A0ABS3JC52_9BACT|nr:histidine kinase [Fibrella forsythiae]MBO0947571.1 ATP-binding protein [Fibrella forsythiae]
MSCLLLAVTTLGQQSAPETRVASVTIPDEYGQAIVKYPPFALNLEGRQNYISFRLKAAVPTRIQYRLDGLDNEWIDGLSTDHIHYSNLPGGSYKFQLKSQFSDHTESVTIQVKAPIWRKWWFVPTIFAYLIGVIGLVVYLFMQYRFRQKLRVLQARDRIARDLHDDMGSYLSSISILSQTAHRNTIRDPEKTQLALDRIGQTARRVMESMNDMVWSINPSNDSMTQVVTRMTDAGNSLFNDTPVDFNIQVGDDLGTFPISAEARRDLFLIFKEAITNAARYAQASRVRASLQRTQTGLLLQIQDDGRGFDPQQPAYQNPGGGNGLINMQKRATTLGGELTVISRIGEGTTVRLLV